MFYFQRLCKLFKISCCWVTKLQFWILEFLIFDITLKLLSQCLSLFHTLTSIKQLIEADYVIKTQAQRNIIELLQIKMKSEPKPCCDRQDYKRSLIATDYSNTHHCLISFSVTACEFHLNWNTSNKEVKSIFSFCNINQTIFNNKNNTNNRDDMHNITTKLTGGVSQEQEHKHQQHQKQHKEER